MVAVGFFFGRMSLTDSKQVDPISLYYQVNKYSQTTRMRMGSLTSSQMRSLSKEGIPGICKETLVDQAVASLNWEIVSPTGEKDANTEFYSNVLREANDGEGAASFFMRLADDVLSTLQGGHFEILLGANDIPIKVYNVDSTTIFRNRFGSGEYSREQYPWIQRVYNEEVYFKRNELAHLYWHPSSDWDERHRNICPVELAYFYISVLASSDDTNLELLTDAFPAGVLSLPGATREEAQSFKDSWDYAIRGGSLRDIAVLYGEALKQAQHIKFTRPPTDMAFEITNHWYAALVAAAYEMSILDISILTKVSTKAGAESQERMSQQQGQRKLRKVIDEAIETWLLPSGYNFKWIIPRPEDDITLAKTIESRTRAISQLTASFGPDKGEEYAIRMGLLPARDGMPDNVHHLKSQIAERVVVADLNGSVSLSEWEDLQNQIVTYQETLPEGVWGQELYDLAYEQYYHELMLGLDTWESEVEETPREAAKHFQWLFEAALLRAASRVYIAGKQDAAAEDEDEARAIALAGLTIADISIINQMIAEAYRFFRGYARRLAEEGIDYLNNTEWRTNMYARYLRRFFLQGKISTVNPREDLIEIVEGVVRTEHCSVCPPRWGKWTLEEYNAFDPSGPPPNWCEGFDNCACSLRILRNVR